MWPSSPCPPCCHRVWCVAVHTAVVHTFVLAVSRSGTLCRISSAVWSSRPQLRIGDGASFISLNMWALSRVWPVLSLMITTCCHRSRKWEVLPLSALPQGRSDEGLLFLEGDTAILLSSFGSKFGKLICFFISWKTAVGWDPLQDYSSLAPSLASSSAFFTSWKTTVSRYPLQDNSSAVLRDIMKAFCETKEFVSCCSYQD